MSMEAGPVAVQLWITELQKARKSSDRKFLGSNDLVQYIAVLQQKRISNYY